MAHIAALAAAGGAWVYTAYSHDLYEKGKQPVEQAPDKPPLHQGAWTHESQWRFAPTREQFVSVKEDVDVNGARIFLVDRGTGSNIVSYSDPRLLY